MKKHRDYYLVALVLIAGLAVTAMSIIKEPEEHIIPIEFSSSLDLTDDEAVEAEIIFYLINRGNDQDIVKIVNYETLDDEYDISITLQGIREVQGSSYENKTNSSKIRAFIATFIDLEKPNIETHLSGWIDENKHIFEFDGVTITYMSGTGHEGSLWAPTKSVLIENESVNASNRFAFELFKQVQREENILFSPFSISAAVSMVYEGANGETADEIESVFHFNTNETQRLMENRQLYESLNNDPGSILETANALWLQTGYPIEESYSAKLRDYYMSDSYQQDFISDPETARETINTWIENKTNNKIKDLFPENSLSIDTRLVLTNAVYFMGSWRYQFNPNNTSPEPFYLNNNITKTVEMMHLHKKYLNYTEVDGAQLLELPYKNSSLSMVLILPQNITLPELEQELTFDKLVTWMESMREQRVNTALPKFTVESEYKLKETPSEMGMPTAFEPIEADFTGINKDGGLFIDKVVHKAFIEVNEVGTEAAAATGVVVELYMMIPTKEFNADHPFIYLIIDNQTGSMLFLGRVVDPSS